MDQVKKPSARERLSDALNVARKKAPGYISRIQKGARNLQKSGRKFARESGASSNYDPFSSAFGGESSAPRRARPVQHQGVGVVYVPVYGRTLAKKQKPRKKRESSGFNMDIPDFGDFNI
jgi:hypothetical protein